MARKAASVTIIDVARAAGVSKSAAARVLAGNGSASERTRSRVLQAAEQLGYRPNQLAKAMKSGTTRTIGVALPDVASPFFSAVLRGLTDTARAAGFEVIVSNTDNDVNIEARSIDLLAEKRVDGLAIAPVLQDASAPLERLSREGLPIVLIDRRLPNLAHIPLSSLDHAAASESAVDDLIDHGHERIAIVTEAASQLPALTQMTDLDRSATSVLKPSAQRLLGYVRALRKRDIEIDPALVITTSYSADSADAAVSALLDDPRGATALHCTDEVLTYGAYRAFVRRDALPPRSLSFIGFDDQDWTTLVRPHVTVVDQATRELGAEAASVLLAIMRDEPVSPDHFLPATLLRRGTVARPHAVLSPR